MNISVSLLTKIIVKQVGLFMMPISRRILTVEFTSIMNNQRDYLSVATVIVKSTCDLVTELSSSKTL